MGRDHKIDNEKRLKSVAEQRKIQEKQKLAIKNAISQSLRKESNFVNHDNSDNSKKNSFQNGKEKLNEFENDEDDYYDYNETSKQGRKAGKLKRNHGNDRFEMDERFQDDYGETYEEEEYDDNNFKTKRKNSHRKFKQFDQPTPKMIRYNPENIDHKIYEIADKSDSVDKPMPEVSTEKYFDVSKSLIADLKGETEKKSSFSLLKSLKGESDDEDESNESPAMVFPTNDEFTVEKRKFSKHVAKTNKSQNSKTPPKNNLFKSDKKGSSSQPFFFTGNDSRLAEGSLFFCRCESEETLRQSWIEKRSAVQKEFVGQKKRALHRINPVQRLGNKKRFNFINARKKRFN